jgi:L-asparaginase
MQPYSINPIEATSNLMSAYGFLKANTKNNIFISMHGFIKQYKKIRKNRTLGIFECH